MINPDIILLADFIGVYLEVEHTKSLRQITDYSRTHYGEFIEEKHVVKALKTLEERGKISANWETQRKAAPLFTYIGT